VSWLRRGSGERNRRTL